MGVSAREPLHQLVDALPEAALAMVEQALQYLQTWPPEMPRGAENTQGRLQALIAKRTARWGNRVISGRSLLGSGDSVATASGTEGGAEVTIELRRFRGHEVQIETRLRVSEDKGKLLYSLLIKGPDGKEGHREIEFDIADIPIPPL